MNTPHINNATSHHATHHTQHVTHMRCTLTMLNLRTCTCINVRAHTVCNDLQHNTKKLKPTGSAINKTRPPITCIYAHKYAYTIERPRELNNVVNNRHTMALHQTIYIYNNIIYWMQPPIPARHKDYARRACIINMPHTCQPHNTHRKHHTTQTAGTLQYTHTTTTTTTTTTTISRTTPHSKYHVCASQRHMVQSHTHQNCHHTHGHTTDAPSYNWLPNGHCNKLCNTGNGTMWCYHKKCGGPGALVSKHVHRNMDTRTTTKQNTSGNINGYRPSSSPPTTTLNWIPGICHRRSKWFWAYEHVWIIRG